MPERFGNADAPLRGWYLAASAALLLYAAGFLLYSQTWAFAWDESYHLLAAQLILSGKKPYIDFCFPQTPLNAYWNAAWMRLLGQSWRVAHAVAGLLTIGAVLLTADFFARRFPVRSWRIAGALTVALAAGLNAMVFLFGPLAQPYGMCLLTLALAFRFCVRAAGKSSALLPAAAGFFAGSAAASSLLSAAAGPVLFVWMLVYHRAGSRWSKAAGFLAGGAIPFAPVFWLAALGPRETWFNVVQYHAHFRKLYWPDTTRHDLEVLTSWIGSGQALVLGLLALFGLLYVARRSEWPRALKAEFYLCAWLAAALAAEVGRAHPTFPQYFLLTAPFLAILAGAGLYAVGSRVLQPDRPLWPVLLAAVLFLLGLGQALYDHRDYVVWADYERLAARIDQVTPPNARLFATEPLYFLTRRTPPPGYELHYTHKVNLPPAERARLHILTEAEVKQQVQSGMFATAISCDDDQIDDYGLKKLYSRSAETGECTIFWDLKGAAGVASRPHP
ncbi:MAG: hypothetical protein JST11_08410 [Acidobacteria bacterium]|nr:hypothetical protein [Acidobacteriota bacterium]